LKGGVVGTVMTNMAMELALNKLGVAFGRAKVGDRYVLEMLHANGWQVGGEASGHILCLDKHTTGDGIISSLQVLASLAELGISLEEACSDWTPFPQTMINVRHNGCDWKAASAEALAAAEAALSGIGRVVLRPSGTEPVVRVMVEASDRALSERWAREIAATIERVA
jgi:phosphoglucosamine mutase